MQKEQLQKRGKIENIAPSLFASDNTLSASCDKQQFLFE